MPARRRHRLALVVLASACATPPPPPVGALTVRPTRAAVAATTAIHAGEQQVQVRLLAVTTAPAGVAVESAASAITTDRDAPFRATSALPVGSRWLGGPAAAAWLAALPPRTLELAAATGVVDGELATTVDAGRELPVAVCEPGAGEGLEIRLRTRVAATARTELLFVRDPLRADDTVVLFVPTAEPPYVGRALVLRHAGAAPPAALAAARATAQPTAVPPLPTDTRHLARTAVGEHNRRPALLAIARAAGAGRCIDVLLAADEPALVAIGDETARTPATDDPFGFERALWRGLLPRLERDELPPGLAACVTRTLGAVAEDPAGLSQLLQSHGTAERFAAALRDANVQALADRDALVRTVATEWLRAQGTEVPGYEPCGDPERRRAALRAFLANDPTEGPR